MKKIFCILLAIGLFCINAFAQYPEMHAKHGHFYLDGQQLSNQEIQDIFPDGYNSYKAERFFRGTGIAFTSVGAIATVGGIALVGEAVSIGNRPSDTPGQSIGNGLGAVLLGAVGAYVGFIGAGVTIFGGLVWGGSAIAMNLTCERYNDTVYNPELSFGATPSGVGLCLTF